MTDTASVPPNDRTTADMLGPFPEVGMADSSRAPSRGEFRLMRLPEFLEQMYQLVRMGRTQTATVAAIDYVDCLLNDGLFRACNDLLLQIDLTKMPSALRRSFLMVTDAAKDKLPARAVVYREALGLLAKERGKEAGEGMLRPLA